MHGKQWILTDQAHAINLHDVTLGAEEVGGPARGYLVHKKRLAGGLSEGVEMVEVDNGCFRFCVLPTRGMGLWKAWLGDFELGWRSPVRGPVHPAFVPIAEPSGLGFLDGFDELLARCGLMNNGAPEFDQHGKLLYPLHGRIANLPAHYLEAAIDGESGQIRITGEVAEARFLRHALTLRSSIITRVGQPGLVIEDEVINMGGRPAEFQLLYHINLGRPLLDAGARVSVALEELVPRDSAATEGVTTWDVYSGPIPGFTEQVYFMKLLGDAHGQARALLASSDDSQALELIYPLEQLPYFSLWKNTAEDAQGYVTGLEPATNLPNVRSFEGARGRVVTLAPGESAKFTIEFAMHSGAAKVAAARDAIRHIQQRAVAKIHEKPQPGWSAGVLERL